MQRTAFFRTAAVQRYGILILLAALCLITGAAETAGWADSVTCSACGKTIRGEYLVLDGHPYCSQNCIDTVLPACAVCGEAIRGPHLTFDGKRYCSQACLDRNLPACDMCGRPVQGQYFESKGKTYCSDDCYQLSLPRCEACGEGMKEWREIEGRLYCHPCAA
jgi:hypothetical protein